MSDVDDVISKASFGVFDPAEEERKRKQELRRLKKKLTPEEAPVANDRRAQIMRERSLAKASGSSTGRASTVLTNGSNRLG